MKSIGSQSILTNSGISTGGHRGFGGGFGGFGGGHGGFGGGRGFGGKKPYSLLSCFKLIVIPVVTVFFNLLTSLLLFSGYGR